MGIILFLLTAATLAIIATPLLKKEKNAWWIVFIGSIIISAFGTYAACQDGWSSRSIGRQGACSWHGGVVARLSEFGWGVLIVSLFIIIGAFIYNFIQRKK